MSLCMSNVRSLFMVPSTRRDVRPRACAMHDAHIVSLFTAIYRLVTMRIGVIKGYIALDPRSACS